MVGSELRLRRLLGDSRAVIVAADHGLFDGPIPGMEVLPETVRRINPMVDGVLLAPGMVRHCDGVFGGKRRPLAIVRLNWNTTYCFKYRYRKAKSVYCYDVESALREGMDVALVSLTLQTGDEERDAANVEIFTALVTRCHALGVPVIGEYFPAGHEEMPAEQMAHDVLIGSRIVAELGADAIKTFYTRNFADVTRCCPVPVLGLGAEKLPTPLDALKLAAAEVEAGAGGVVFGRNALQVDEPLAFQAALCEVVWNGTSPAQALKKAKPARGHRAG